jgi:ABC-type polysaccharide/polyol phosphate transport system ATPase subunit
MSKIAIRAENISKQYRLGEIGTGTISHDLNRWWNKVRGKEDPFLKIGDSNDRTQKGESDYVWSLKDINFEINQGDAVGIIGRNGAGKSTLLKLLSKVTKPTTGQFKVNGRIASLLEVGTGFHPEMTGRENIYLNGAILGMSRAEISRKFDEIVDFAGIERYIDTPVKRYSSGMYVRLAFAVAAHLESEILIVDEVLAVGDAEFQKKCLGKMENVSQQEGRTILLVSHNINSIYKISNKVLFLDNGNLRSFGNNVGEVISEYITNGESGFRNNWVNNLNFNDGQDLFFKRAYLSNSNGEIKSNYLNSESIYITIEVLKNSNTNNLVLAFNICKPSGEYLIRSHFDDYKNEFVKSSLLAKKIVVTFKIPSYFLSSGEYVLKFDIGVHCVKKYSDFSSDLDLLVSSEDELGDRFHYMNSEIANSIVRPNLVESVVFDDIL